MMRASHRDLLRASQPEADKGGPGASPGEDRGGERIIVHVDMDAFFAAIEEHDNPALSGHPVIVGGPKGSRGIVTTANYEARRYGVHSGMSLARAEQLCPHALHVGTSGGKYSWTSLKLMSILRRFSPIVEPASIDEAYLDATGCIRMAQTDNVASFGRAIKQAIQDELQLTASVGIGPSRIVAKIASGLQKPDGLTVVPSGELLTLLGELPVERVPGVGPASAPLLKRSGITTIADLLASPRALLQQQYGKHAVELQKRLLGETGRTVLTTAQAPDDKSMGHERTFWANVQSRDELVSELLELSDRVGRRMRRAGYLARVLTLKLRSADFETHEKQRQIKPWTDEPGELHRCAIHLLDRMWRPGNKAVRLIGISASGLIKPNPGLGPQDDLFQAEQRQRRREVWKSVDQLRNQYGEDVLGLAGSMQALQLHRRNREDRQRRESKPGEEKIDGAVSPCERIAGAEPSTA